MVMGEFRFLSLMHSMKLVPKPWIELQSHGVWEPRDRSTPKKNHMATLKKLPCFQWVYHNAHKERKSGKMVVGEQRLLEPCKNVSMLPKNLKTPVVGPVYMYICIYPPMGINILYQHWYYKYPTRHGKIPCIILASYQPEISLGPKTRTRMEWNVFKHAHYNDRACINFLKHAHYNDRACIIFLKHAHYNDQACIIFLKKEKVTPY